MKAFEAIVPDRETCLKEFEELRDLLSEKDKELSESGDILPFFRDRKQLTALLGSFHPRITICDRIAHEYNLDDFRCDFVVGDFKRASYCFIEFEDAKSDSVFRDTVRSVSEWSPRFDHGFSQLIDWAYKLSELEKSPDTHEAKFGNRKTDFMFMLVVGREHFLTLAEQNRLSWRWQRVIVNSQQIRCITFDELFAELEFAIKTYGTAADIDSTTELVP